MSGNLSEKQWYIVNTYSSHENKVALNLKRTVESLNLQDKIFRILVAEHEVPVLKEGIPTGKTKMKNLYPGYIFVEMIMTNETWYYVRNTEGVTGITGSSGGGQKPTPVSREEMEPVLKRMGMIDESMYDRYKVGDYVKIIHGAFEGTEGRILDINKETGTCRIETLWFGRPTPTDVEFAEIELK
jgi:transcriptional antiterminator NusG